GRSLLLLLRRPRGLRLRRCGGLSLRRLSRPRRLPLLRSLLTRPGRRLLLWRRLLSPPGGFLLLLLLRRPRRLRGRSTRPHDDHDRKDAAPSHRVQLRCAPPPVT